MLLLRQTITKYFERCDLGAVWDDVTVPKLSEGNVCHQHKQQKRACMYCSTTTTLHSCIGPRAVNHCNSSGTYSQAPKHRRKAPPSTLLHSCLALLSCALQSFQALKAVASPLFLILLAMALQALLRWWNCSQDSQAVATAWFVYKS